jgi:hypothetical protein
MWWILDERAPECVDAAVLGPRRLRAGQMCETDDTSLMFFFFFFFFFFLFLLPRKLSCDEMNISGWGGC